MLSGSDKILENNNILEPISCNNLFTPEECKEIILNSEGSESQDATIGTKDQINSYVRKTKVKYLALNNNNMWIGKKIIPVAEQINNLRYKFNITRIKELQVLEYREDSFFDWHIDLRGNTDGSTRKLSFIVFLSDTKDYEGGQLTWDMKENKNYSITPMTQGSMIIFPSFLPHKVEKVTKGIRHSLVGWIHGPVFQ